MPRKLPKPKPAVKFIIKYISVFKWINLPKQICIHLLGERHPQSHRIAVGFVLASIGVGVSKLFPTITVLHYMMDGLGYMIHGIATIPVAEWLGRIANASDEHEDEEEEPDEPDEEYTEELVKSENVETDNANEAQPENIVH